jgi:anthranilate synthase component 1
VSGAPKIMAIKLVGGLEKERRGVYAGAVGRFDWSNDSLDTAIAIRTMTYKDGVVYLQAGKSYGATWITLTTGGGIVFDSDEAEEYQETINKLGANVKCIDEAESKSLTSIHYIRLTGQNTLLASDVSIFPVALCWSAYLPPLSLPRPPVFRRET